MNTEFSLGKALFFRFLRGFIAGAVGSMIMINVGGANTFADIQIFLTALLYAAITGGITGGLMTLDKYIRSYE